MGVGRHDQPGDIQHRRGQDDSRDPADCMCQHRLPGVFIWRRFHSSVIEDELISLDIQRFYLGEVR